MYKYTKEPQSTEADETDSNSDTERQHGQNIFFVFVFFDLRKFIFQLSKWKLTV